MKHLLFVILFFFATHAQGARDNFDNIDGKDYYEFFGISVDADEGAIKSAYRNLMKQFHPDSPLQKDVEMSKTINNVNDVLGDPATRQRYDHWRGVGTQNSEETLRETELKRNADYVIREAAKVRSEQPHATFDQIAQAGRFYVIYAIRFMPFANYTTQDLWRLFSGL